MFTGIVREIGRVSRISHSGDTRIRISCARPVETIEIGASIACGGVCLTVVALGTDGEGTWFEVDASTETRNKTSLGDWREGGRVNLEPALRLGDELGGHIVSGHVDSVGIIRSVGLEGASHRVSIEVPQDLAKFIARKGSITVDGISLTVNEVDGAMFGINVIPHTWAVTTLSDAAVGAKVNLEIDVLARYVARLNEVA